MTNYDALPGRSSANARRALELAVERGFAPELVRTTKDGYLIPTNDDSDAVAEDALTGAVTPEPPKKPARRRNAKKE